MQNGYIHSFTHSFVMGDLDPIPGGLSHQVIKMWGILSWGIMSLSGSGAGDFVKGDFV